jgi:hypothetical protein
MLSDLSGKRFRLWFAICAVSVMVATGCGSVSHQLVLNQDYVPSADTKVAIGPVNNNTGHEYDIYIVDMFKGALQDKLAHENIMWGGDGGEKITISTKIIEYEEGNAFQRWLLPGWGTTVLSVQCELRNGERLVGSVEARRTVSAGGGYTIGAWRYIFMDVAEDVAKELRAKLP